MSIYANLGGVAGDTATFYLAEVAALHAGKTMQLTLFDSGEGAQSIEVLDPNGEPGHLQLADALQPADTARRRAVQRVRP